METFKSVNDALDYFYVRLFEIINDIVPKITHSSGRRRFPVWFTKDLKRNIQTKNYYRTKWRTEGNRKYLNAFRRLRTLVKAQISSEYDGYLAEVQNQIKSDPSACWRYLDQRRRSTRIPGIFHGNGRLYDDPSDIVNLFGDHFSDMESLARNDNSDSDILTQLPPIIIPSVTEDEIRNIMSKFPNKLTFGDDQIPSLLLRGCSSALAKPLQLIISMSLRSSTFPNRWKRARIIPIFKKGDSSLVENYRPISVLPNFAKVYEEILYSCIYHHVKPHLSSRQHGFIRGRSTVTNLATLSQDLAESLDDGGQIDVIYTDFSRAFDTIDHVLLLRKLGSFGLAPSFLFLMRSYLKERMNYVFCNGFKSYEYELKTGVPQGSNLGPLLFVIFINDLLCSISCRALAYADDLKLYLRICRTADVLRLQSSLEFVHGWCLRNGIILNLKKCFKVTYTRKMQSLTFNYHIGDHLIATGSRFRDLGVLFDSDLSFVPHIEEICASSCRSLGFLFRSFREFDDLSALRSVYFSLVVSKLEYANLIWFPIYATHLTSVAQEDEEVS